MSGSLIQLLVVFGLIALNGVFTAAEFALVSVRASRINELAEAGNGRAIIAQRAIQNPGFFISACQIGITMASLALGWVAEPTFAGWIAPLFEPLLGDNTPIGAHVFGGIVAYAVVTFLHIVFGEQSPKMIALQRSEPVVLTTAPIVSRLTVPFRPFIALLDKTTDLVLKPFGIQRRGEAHDVYSEEELKRLVLASQQQGFLERSEREIIHRVFGFADVLTEQIMVPRTEMSVLHVDDSLADVTDVVADTGHARYPVYGENHDDILGVVYTKDLFRFVANPKHPAFSLRRMMRTPLIVPATMALDDLLQQMKLKRNQIAIVVDEYGGTAGMVTLEDVVERIVGDVQDEFEQVEEDVETLPNGEVRVSGLMSIEEFNNRFGLEIEDPFYNTIGGYVFGQLGRRPEIGDEVPADGRVLKIAQLDGLRIDRLILAEPSTAEPSLAERQAR
jgi:CBS domain containing-hemolysin-like protein